MAHEVIGCGFKGLYLDANAISPQQAIRVGQAMTEAGVEFVDRGIIRGPAWKPDSTLLYLSGKEAERIADCFSDGPLQTSIIGESVGKASSLKKCFR